MRILNIYFKNINSLAGESRINFAQGPLAESGVFAITGPNGSGKTSILDAITLGLYGETFRFDKPAAHIITKHAEESLARVEFAFAGKNYRSSWQVNRTNLGLPTMQLVELGTPETVLAESPAQVRDFLTRMTGLDFHRFSKAIILPQGDFAGFLNALDSERLDILEKISGGDFLSDYQQKTQASKIRLQDQINQLQQELTILPVLDDATMAAATQDLQDFLELGEELTAEQQQLAQQLQTMQIVHDLQDKQQELQAKQQQLQTTITAQQADLAQLAQVPVVAAFKQELSMLESMQTELSQQQQLLGQYRQDYSSLQAQLASADPQQLNQANGKSWQEQKQQIDNLKLAISELKMALASAKDGSPALNQQIQEKQTALQEVENWLQTNTSDAALQTDFPDIVQLRQLRNELNDLGGKHKTQFAWSKRTTASVQKNKTDLAAAQSRQIELQQEIISKEQALLEIAQGQTFTELKELLADQQSRLSDFQEFYDIAAVVARFSEKKSWLSWFGRPQPTTTELPNIDQLQTRVNQMKQDYAAEENIGKALEQAIANETILKKLTSQRNKLVDGKPCLLCGSTHHPYAVKLPQLTDSKRALGDQKTKLIALKTELEGLERQFNQAQKQQNNATAKQKFLVEKLEAWQILANKLNVLRDGLTIDQLGRIKELLDTETAEFTKIRNLVNEHAKLQRDIISAKDEIVAKQTLAANLQIVAEQLDATWSEHAPGVDELVSHFQKTQEEEAALSKRLETQLKQFGEKMPGKGKEDGVFDRLNKRRQDYHSQELKRAALQEELAALTTSIQEGQANILHYQQQLNEHLEALRDAEQAGLHLAVFDKQQRITELESQLNEQHIVFTSLQRSFNEKIAAAGFQNMDELSHILTLVDQQDEIQARLTDNISQLERYNFQLLQLETRLQKESQSFDDSITEPELLQMQKLLAEKADIAKQEVITLQNKLDKQQRYRQRHGKLSSELAAVASQLNAIETELTELNASPGEIKQKIRQLLIDKLLGEANRILEKISGRYYLRSSTSEHGLALEIEDSKQQNARRQPKTLSGGESFIVSLALALSLAEIANHGQAIDSLFLDEGFGNLDAEALYQAMTTLENLKFQGKTVGVISHVDAVKKRIKTQITLVKNANGHSELQLVA